MRAAFVCTAAAPPATTSALVMARAMYVRRDMVGVGLVRVLAVWWRTWIQRRARTRDHRQLRASCDAREQRLEDANAPALLVDLHTIVYAVSRAGVRPTDIEELLERYVDLLIDRQRYLVVVRRSRPRHLEARRALAIAKHRPLSAEVLGRRLALSRACELAINTLDRDITDLALVIRLYCERALLPHECEATRSGELRRSRRDAFAAST